jgi:8-oxo-dGTP pyrophosphatase MutT (NUDIX family)
MPQDTAPDDTLQTDPWTVVGSREVYVNPWIRVREDQVIRPDSKPGIYGVVEFANYALGVVVVTDTLDTYLVGQWRYTLGRYSWEIPEGGGKKSLPPLVSAQRELREETGITASEWVDLGLFDLSNSVTDEIGFIFLARELTLGESEPDGDEVLNVKRIPLADARAMCLDGRITDGVSIIGILRAWEWLVANGHIASAKSESKEIG